MLSILNQTPAATLSREPATIPKRYSSAILKQFKIGESCNLTDTSSNPGWVECRKTDNVWTFVDGKPSYGDSNNCSSMYSKLTTVLSQPGKMEDLCQPMPDCASDPSKATNSKCECATGTKTVIDKTIISGRVTNNIDTYYCKK
jgi:hypothetical protein